MAVALEPFQASSDMKEAQASSTITSNKRLVVL